MKIVINRQYGGFGLSNEGFEAYLDRKGITYYKWPGEFGETCYTTVPEAEYKQILESDTKKDPGVGRFEQSNAAYLTDREIERNDPALIAVVEELGEVANSRFAELKVVEIPDEVEWQIDEYDGMEWVAEQHRTWS